MLVSKPSQETFFIPQDKEAFESVFQLSNVARPWIAIHMFEGSLVDLYFSMPVNSVEGSVFLEEMLAQRNNVFCAIPEWWEVHGDHV